MAKAGGYAAIHAARARKFKAALDEIEQALARAGIDSDPDLPIEQRLTDAVSALANEVVSLRRRIEDEEWERA